MEGAKLCGGPVQAAFPRLGMVAIGDTLRTKRRRHRSHGSPHLPLMDDKRVKGRRSRLGIRAVGHAGRPEAVRELLLEGLSPQEGPQRVLLVACTESRADALRA